MKNLYVFLVALFAAQLAYGEQKEIPVFAYKVAKAEVFDEIEALGTLKANERVDLTASVTDTITKLHFNDGQRVVKGDVLAEMTDTEESALVKENTARVEEAKKQYDRVRKLPKQGAISESIVDQRRREYEAAKAQLEAMISRLHDRLILAPFSGVIGLRQISVGALVTPGELIAVIVDDSVMKLDFAVPEIYLNVLSVDLPVVARAAAYPEREFKGKIVALDSEVDPGTRSIQVRALVPNENKLLKPGMLMSVTIRFNFREALIIPEEAVVQESRKSFVYSINELGKAVKKEIQLGVRSPGKVELLAGLSEGEQIITHGLQALDKDSKVKVRAYQQIGEGLKELLQKGDSSV